MLLEAELRVGVRPVAAIDALRDLARDGGNVLARGGTWDVIQHRYLEWVDAAELNLRSLFHDAEVWQRLHSERYWHIRDLRPGAPRPASVLDLEAQWQVGQLTSLAEELERRYKMLEVPDHCAPVVIDTNVFVHYRPFDQVDWPTVVDARKVRIITPLLGDC